MPWIARPILVTTFFNMLVYLAGHFMTVCLAGHFIIVCLFNFLAAYLLSAMDRTADPCHDFFQYACGSWNRKHVIPEDRSSISTFEVMADQLQVVLKGEF